jgi:hypothetical protein
MCLHLHLINASASRTQRLSFLELPHDDPEPRRLMAVWRAAQVAQHLKHLESIVLEERTESVRRVVAEP